MRKPPSSDRIPAVTGQTGIGESFTLNTERLSSGLIVTTATGTVNATFVARLRYQLMNELDNESQDWILEATRIEKFERDASTSFVDILSIFRARKGGRIIVVANDNLKMMLSTISMSSMASGGPTLEIVASLELAMIQLRTKTEERGERR